MTLQRFIKHASLEASSFYTVAAIACQLGKEVCRADA